MYWFIFWALWLFSIGEFDNIVSEIIDLLGVPDNASSSTHREGPLELPAGIQEPMEDYLICRLESFCKGDVEKRRAERPHFNPEAGLANQVQRKPQEEILHVHNGRGGCCSTGQDSSKIQGIVPEDKSAEFTQHSGGKLKAGRFAPLARKLLIRVEDPIS